MPANRRQFLRDCAALGAAAALPASFAAQAAESKTGVRQYHASLSIDAFKADPGLADIIRDAGVSDVWLACFFQGQWYHPIEEVIEWRDRLRTKGLEVHNITIPLGHPSFTENAPDYMPNIDAAAWKPGIRPDGRKHYGVALHPPITEANVEAVKKIKTTDPKIIFLDDDFRLAPSPADIGGCFCEEHRRAFLEKYGFGGREWEALLAMIEGREYTGLVQAWVEDICDDLTACFKAQQAAASPEAQLGIMVMYMGSEKSGIRLSDYRGVPMRVGELMFEDRSFAPVKGKTNELFSALFHRRFVSPELAFSETTAWPPDKLSADNMAAKLCISTLSDVRNTMFMSGNTPFPRTHWATLAPAMHKNAGIHARVAGQIPRGPLKHYWGEASRYVGDDNPYSLFLALGIPFEVAQVIPNDGWTFLSDFDARAAAAGSIQSHGSTLVCKPSAGAAVADSETVSESLEELFSWKRRMIGGLGKVPYVVEETPVVCAWYPEARSVVLWNLLPETVSVTLRSGDSQRRIALGPLGIEWVEEAGA
jgi:hypothetical protein